MSSFNSLHFFLMSKSEGFVCFSLGRFSEVATGALRGCLHPVPRILPAPSSASPASRFELASLRQFLVLRFCFAIESKEKINWKLDFSRCGSGIWVKASDQNFTQQDQNCHPILWQFCCKVNQIISCPEMQNPFDCKTSG